MVVRALASLTVIATLAAVAGDAHAVNKWVVLANQIDARTRFIQESYVGYGERSGDAFSSRQSWIELRPMRGARVGSARLLTPRTVARTRRAPLPYQPSTHVGGLGSHITSGGEYGPSLGGITGGGSSSTQAPPSFGALHEGGPSFGFNRPQGN